MADSAAMQLPLALKLREGIDFDAFVAGGNGVLVDELRKLAAGDCDSPVFLWGETGSGRTHLLEATVREALAGGGSACLLPAAEIRGLGPEVLDGMEHFGLLAIDDLDLLAGRKGWDEALFHLYNRCRDAGGGLLFAAAAAPAALDFILPDLSSRLAAGPVFRVQPLGEEALVELVSRRAARRGLRISAEVAGYLVARAERRPAALMQVLEVLDHEAMVQRRRITVPFVRQVMGWH